MLKGRHVNHICQTLTEFHRYQSMCIILLRKRSAVLIKPNLLLHRSVEKNVASCGTSQELGHPKLVWMLSRTALLPTDAGIYFRNRIPIIRVHTHSLSTVCLYSSVRLDSFLEKQPGMLVEFIIEKRIHIFYSWHC